MDETCTHKRYFVKRRRADDSHFGYSGDCYVCENCGRVLTDGVKVTNPKTAFRAEKFGTLNYCVYEPIVECGKKVPLILFLHGAGERGDDNSSQLKNAIKKVYLGGKWKDSVIIAPQCPKGQFWVNYPHENGCYYLNSLPKSSLMSSVIDLVKSYVKKDYIDGARVYVIGLSMGGFATWYALAAYPDLFAAGVPVCSAGPIDAVETLKEIPVYCFHGKFDKVVPYATGTPVMYDAIVKAHGNKIIFVPFNAFHHVWDRAITYRGDGRNPSLEDWLFAQRKELD